jgi:molybdopterin-guanine dinucleotide biosynthesis protein B
MRVTADSGRLRSPERTIFHDADYSARIMDIVSRALGKSSVTRAGRSRDELDCILAMVPQQTAPEPVRIGVLLAGGESRRMGRDKRGLRLGGETLLRRNLAFLGGVFPVVGLSVRSAAQAPADLPEGVVIIPDEVPGSPMGGLAGILAHFGEPIFALAADLIAPDPAAVARVLDAYRDADVSLPVAEDHLEPLHAVYGPRCLPHMRQLLAAGAHSILDLFPLVRVARVPFTDATPFFNVNTPDDWAEARRRVDGADADARTPGVAGDAPGASAGDRRASGGPVVLGLVGRPNNGKTTLIERIIPELNRLGLRVGAVKRVAKLEIDHPGKDSWRHSHAGAEAYAVGSPGKVAFVERRTEATLEEIVARYFGDFDVVVCEGYRREAPDVVEIFRSGAGYESTVCELHEPVALVTDADLAHPHRFGLDDTPALVSFLVERLGLTPDA